MGVRRLALLIGCGFLILAPFASAESARPTTSSSVRLPSSNASAVTIYGASWCSACKALERGLKERDVPFDVIDVDQSPDAYAKARAETRSNAIPQTAIARGNTVQWIIGANVDAVERAYRGE